VRLKRHKILLPVVTVTIFLAFLFGGCTRSPSSEKPASKQLEPKRIVSLSPSITEILYGVGAWKQVVAVSEYCTYPSDVVNKPRVAGWGNTNLEQVMSLKPDLVIGVEGQAAALREKLTQLGIRSVFVNSQTLNDIFTSISEIGRVTEHEKEANELATQTRRELDAVRVTVQNRQRPRVLCVVDRVPGTIRDLYSATRGSFLDDLIAIAGGDSIAPPAENGYGKITKEAVVTINPDVIIDLVQGSNGENPQAIWRELSEISAVRQGRIYSLRDPSVVHPSQFVGHTAQLLAQAIHPEAFK
jgi:iron complex transport system substrate-binding protein